MRLEGFIKNQFVIVLVDNGFAHNFLQYDMIEKLQLEVTVIRSFFVITGGGQKLYNDKLCRGVSIKVQDVIVKMNLFVLPMSGANVIIFGAQ